VKKAKKLPPVKAPPSQRNEILLAGHEDLRTTQRYLHSERSDLVQAMETFAK
jgi:hypothetical protein